MASAATPLWADLREGKAYRTVEVTRLLSGNSLALGLHIVTGRKEGPTLGVMATVHGDETFPAMALRTLVNKIDTGKLAGRLVVLPVANPLALASFARQTPEQHSGTDLHVAFPGNPKGSLTQAIAAKITETLLDHVDALIDFHSGGAGGRLQSRVDFDQAAPAAVQEQCLRLCRAFGVTFIHRNNLNGTASQYVNRRGVPTVNPEIGGAYLGASATERYMREAVAGVERVMVALGMLPEVETDSPIPERQLLYGVESRYEANPTKGGYLVSYYESPDDLGRRIPRGTKLGEVVDLHSFQVLEEIFAPVDGYLFFSRYSGVVEAGTKGFALAEEATSRWL